MEHESNARRMVGFAQVLLVVGSILSPSVSVAGDLGQWWLEVSAAGKTYRVCPDGSGWTEVPHVVSRGVLSPDGNRVVYADVPEENKPRRNSEIFVADADGKNARRLTKGEARNSSPTWSPDGKRILFESNRENPSDIFATQLYAMDAGGTQVEQLTRETEGARLPKFAPDGRLAYLALRKALPQKRSIWFQDLVVRDGEKSEAITQNRLLYEDYAWSPDGKTIAYGKLGGLVFYDLATGKEYEIDHAKMIDSQMRGYATHGIAWRPDNQAVACYCSFFGGRAANGPKMIGDEEIFIIPREGRPTWFTSPKGRPQSLAWVRP
jgi:dipeptidyl aminopeptidase/acylaminoacyl peptidase